VYISPDGALERRMLTLEKGSDGMRHTFASHLYFTCWSLLEAVAKVGQ
jgi:hypothetical protein